MTVEEYEAIDVQVAEAVFGLRFVKANTPTGYTVDGQAFDLPAFSTNMAEGKP